MYSFSKKEIKQNTFCKASDIDPPHLSPTIPQVFVHSFDGAHAKTVISRKVIPVYYFNIFCQNQ